jgi:lipopolysaccharide exporter
VGAVGMGLLLILPAGIGISMVADPMVRLSLGEHWLAAIPVVQIMAIGGTTAIFTHSCATLLNAIGRPRVTLYIGVVSTLLKLIALVFLVPAFGLPGASVALLIANGVDLVGFLLFTLPRIGISLWRLAACAVRPTTATAAMVALLWQLNMAWTPTGSDGVLALSEDAAMRSVIGATCYGIVLMGSWLAAGRPDGAERFTLTMIGSVWARMRRRV